jgi:hypothetical protein
MKGELADTGKKPLNKDGLIAKTRKGTKRKRGDKNDGDCSIGKGASTATSREDKVSPAEQEKLAKRQRIIARKRKMRRSRVKGAGD